MEDLVIVQIFVRDNNVDQALKALKKKMQREGIFREMKLRGHYEKPSEKRAREQAEAVRRARKMERFLSQPFYVAEIFTGYPGVTCKLEETIDSFERIANGEGDDLPESAFMYVGTLDDARKKAEKMAAAV